METKLYMTLFSKQDCKYTSCYCEENSYLLCKKFIENLSIDSKIDDKTYRSQGYCIFVTNPKKQAEIRFQQAGKQDIYKTVIWDYHVFFIHNLQNIEDTDDKISKVYDLDTVLQFPEAFENYFEKSFQFEKKYELIFRVIEASQFVDHFASDRSHMVIGVKKEGKKYVKEYSAPIPDYPNIVNKNKETMNLEKYWDTKNTDPNFGKLLTQSEFYAMFASNKN